MRVATIERKTKETDIVLTLSLDGADGITTDTNGTTKSTRGSILASGDVTISTGVPFFDHMLDAFGRHGMFGLEVHAIGDLDVDAHHTVEDVGIVLGQAILQALGDKTGITRYGHAFIPMDEALVLAAIDISGRGQLHWDVALPIEFIGSFDTSLFKEFLIALAANAGITIHVRSLAGENSHHIIEAAAKAVARALATAVAIDARVGSSVPSTKGHL
ncbi:MAG: imidazoleglycerol-phosphate dehydratase HisB [Coriobacteriales bacterium]|jgi:imidazoleglycerol-phosphate dehydratase|nr:imidazoleglycerol-phosphate dehydratase HisB [Coriobacteriales bacterium]